MMIRNSPKNVRNGQVSFDAFCCFFFLFHNHVFCFCEVNELEDKFNEERDRLLGEINQRKEQLNVRQAKAEFQV